VEPLKLPDPGVAHVLLVHVEVDHLRRAIDMSERFRAYAKDDSDFDPIRDEPAFKELIGR
jgi:hypothetical protein